MPNKFRVPTWRLSIFVLIAISVNHAQSQTNTRSTTSPFGNYGPYITRPNYNYRGGYSGIGQYGIQSSPTSPGLYGPYIGRYADGSYRPYGYRYRAPVELYGAYPNDSTKRSGNYPYRSSLYTYRYYDSPGSSYEPGLIDNSRPTTTGIKVRLPVANAEIWFNGVKTKQTGLVREFITPSLQPAQKYQYRVRVVWNANGKLREASRTVQLQAGQNLQIDFTQP